MSTDDSAELRRLQRAAFSRNATEEDQRALARYAAEHPPDLSGDDRSPDSELRDAGLPDAGLPDALLPDAVPANRVDAPAGSPSGRSMLRRRVIAVLALAASLALGWIGGRLTSAPESAPESSLIVFNQPFDSGLIADTDHSGRLEHPDTRYLGTLDGVELFGLIGTADPTSVGLTGQLVCLEIRAEESSSYSCTPLATFLRKGVVLTGPEESGRTPSTYGWGPTGPPRLLTCDPQDCQ